MPCLSLQVFCAEWLQVVPGTAIGRVITRDCNRKSTRRWFDCVDHLQISRSHQARQAIAMRALTTKRAQLITLITLL